jgi:hypothetical protein
LRVIGHREFFSAARVNCQCVRAENPPLASGLALFTIKRNSRVAIKLRQSLLLRRLCGAECQLRLEA